MVFQYERELFFFKFAFLFNFESMEPFTQALEFSQTFV